MCGEGGVGACMAMGGHAWYAQPVIARAVHILLECILVGIVVENFS